MTEDPERIRMMREKKNICPVCFTRMHPQNNVLVCPECGYKLCDHSYMYHDSYSTEHTHTPNYTTASSNPSVSVKYAGQSGSAPSTTPRTNPDAGGKTRNGIRMTAGGKIVTIIVIIYAATLLLSVFSTIIATLFSVLF